MRFIHEADDGSSVFGYIHNLFSKSFQYDLFDKELEDRFADFEIDVHPDYDTIIEEMWETMTHDYDVDSQDEEMRFDDEDCADLREQEEAINMHNTPPAVALVVYAKMLHREFGVTFESMFPLFDVMEKGDEAKGIPQDADFFSTMISAARAAIGTDLEWRCTEYEQRIADFINIEHMPSLAMQIAGAVHRKDAAQTKMLAKRLYLQKTPSIIKGKVPQTWDELGHYIWERRHDEEHVYAKIVMMALDAIERKQKQGEKRKRKSVEKEAKRDRK